MTELTATQERAAIAERFEKARVKAGLSKSGVSEAIGIPRRQLQRLERGLGEITFRQVRQLAALYGVTISFLFLETPESAA